MITDTKIKLKPLQSVAVEILGRDVGVDHDVDQVEVVELGVLLELGALGFQADSALRLLVCANPDISDDFHLRLFDIEPNNHAELSSWHRDQRAIVELLRVGVAGSVGSPRHSKARKPRPPSAAIGAPVRLHRAWTR
jgi:hypothetical protein